MARETPATRRRKWSRIIRVRREENERRRNTRNNDKIQDEQRKYRNGTELGQGQKIWLNKNKPRRSHINPMNQ